MYLQLKITPCVIMFTQGRLRLVYVFPEFSIVQEVVVNPELSGKCINMADLTIDYVSNMSAIYNTEGQGKQMNIILYLYFNNLSIHLLWLFAYCKSHIVIHLCVVLNILDEHHSNQTQTIEQSIVAGKKSSWQQCYCKRVIQERIYCIEHNFALFVDLFQLKTNLFSLAIAINTP